MRVLRENDRWYITLADSRSRCGPFSDVESATMALEELRRLKRLLESKIDYRLIRPLGRGNFGEVWLAKAPGDVDVALKIVSQLNRAQGRQEFKSLERYKNLKHNSLCKVFAFWLVELPENDQAEGKVLKHDEISSEFESAFEPRAGATDETVEAEPADAADQELDGTIRPPAGAHLRQQPDLLRHREDWGGRETPLVKSGSSTDRGGGTPSWATDSGGEGRDRGLIRLIIAMQLGDMTLMDKLEACQRGADQVPAKPGNHGIPQKSLVRYITQAGEAIAYLNTEAGQHCDIKPQNILLVGDGAQVCDFGILRPTGNLMRTLAGRVFTPYFAAPEQHRGEHSNHIDQYSLALTYAKLFTGTFAVAGKTPEELYVKKLNHDLRFEGIPVPQRKVLEKATMPDPDSRYGSVEAFVTALQEAAKPAVHPAKRIALAASLALALVLAAVLSARVFFLPSGPPAASLGAILAMIDADPPKFVEALEQTAEWSELESSAARGDGEEEFDPVRAADRVLEAWWQQVAAAAAGDLPWSAVRECDREILDHETVIRLAQANPVIAQSVEKLIAGRRDAEINRGIADLERRLDLGEPEQEWAHQLELAEAVVAARASDRQREFQTRLRFVRALIPVRNAAEIAAMSRQLDPEFTRWLASIDWNLIENESVRDQLRLRAGFCAALAAMHPLPERADAIRELLKETAGLEAARPENQLIFANWRGERDPDLWLNKRYEQWRGWLEEYVRRTYQENPADDWSSLYALFDQVFRKGFAFSMLAGELAALIESKAYDAWTSEERSKLGELRNWADPANQREQAACRLLEASAAARRDVPSAAAVTTQLANLDAVEVRWARQLLAREWFTRLERAEVDRTELGTLQELCEAARRDPPQDEDLICFDAARLFAHLAAGEPNEAWLESVRNLETASWQERVEAVAPGFSAPMAGVFAAGRLEYALNVSPAEPVDSAALGPARDSLNSWSGDSPLKVPIGQYLNGLEARMLAKRDLEGAIGTTESSGLVDWRAPGPYFLDAPRMTRLLELLEGSIEQELPADAGFAGNYTEQRFQTAARGAAVAMRLRVGLGAEVTPSLQAWRAIGLSRQGNTNAAEWNEVLALCQALVGSPERPPGTSAYDAELHIAHAHALLHADPDDAARDRRWDALGHLWGALRLLNRVAPSGGEPRERFGRALWDRVVGPGVELAKGLDSAAVPPTAEDNLVLYDLYRAGAEILAANPRVQALLRDRLEDPYELAVELLATAANLAPDPAGKVDCLIRRGTILYQTLQQSDSASDSEGLKNRIGRLSGAAREIIAMDDQRPDGHHLEGYAQARLARLAVERRDIRTGFAQAKESLKAAVALERRPAFLKDLAVVLVELSFVCPDNRTELLERASEFADEAIRTAGPAATIEAFNAYMTLGNATEDQAFYVGRFWYYPEAIRAFEDAGALCDRLQPEGQNPLEWQVKLDELKSRARLAAARAKLRYIQDAEFARKLNSDAYESLIRPEWRQELRAAVDDININERRMIGEVETELGSLTRLYPEIAARCALHRAELLLYDHQDQAALEAFQTAYQEAVENNDPETHRARATLIRSSLDAELIKVALENDPSVDELEAVKDVLCRPDRPAERREIVDHWLEQRELVPPGSRPWMYLSFADLWIAYQSRDASRNPETLMERVRELITHAQDGQNVNLELDSRLLLCELLREVVSKTPSQRVVAAREYASTIQWMDRQVVGHVYSLSLRGQLLAFLVDMKGEPDATLQEWFDLARRPWAGEFRIETEVPRMGLKQAIAWSEVISGNRSAVSKLVERIKSAQPGLQVRPLPDVSMGRVPSDCEF